jgi:hypothetical protein
VRDITAIGDIRAASENLVTTRGLALPSGESIQMSTPVWIE